MSLKPIDLLNKKFSRKVRGYSISEVEDFLSATASSFEDTLADNERLRAKVSELEAELGRFRNIEATLNNALVLAQKTADELKVNAQKEADLITREANDKVQRELEQARADLENLRRERERFLLEFRTLLRSHLEVCESNDGGRTTERTADNRS